MRHELHFSFGCCCKVNKYWRKNSFVARLSFYVENVHPYRRTKAVFSSTVYCFMRIYKIPLHYVNLSGAMFVSSGHRSYARGGKLFCRSSKWCLNFAAPWTIFLSWTLYFILGGKDFDAPSKWLPGADRPTPSMLRLLFLPGPLQSPYKFYFKFTNKPCMILYFVLILLCRRRR